MRRHRSIRGLIGLAILLALPQLSLSPVAAAEPLPDSMASTGDSITRAFNTGFLPYLDAPANSWSTGTSTSVNSHYLRLLNLNPAISGRNFNDAVSGAKMADLAGQMTTAAGQHVDYVTVLLGGNDVCRPSLDSMTAVTDFRAQFSTGLNVISTASPNTLVYVVSVPDVYNLWEILHDDSSARSTWDTFGVCQSLLANPLSTAQADVDRRAAVRQRATDFNVALAEICATYTRCRFDRNAAFDTKFTPSDVSTRDYFHPSLAGQAKLAAVSWAAGPYADAVRPITLTTSVVTVKRKRAVDLTWSGAIGASVDLYRNGARLITTANDGAYRDAPKRSGTYTYKVCNAETSLCSNEVGVSL